MWIRRGAVEKMDSISEAKQPLETGGCFAGYELDDGIVILEVIGPGPLAIHERYRFIPDRDYQDEQLKLLWESSERVVRYLGDWHTHPGGTAELSRIDVSRLVDLRQAPEARLRRPVMAVNAGPPWGAVFHFISEQESGSWLSKFFRTRTESFEADMFS